MKSELFTYDKQRRDWHLETVAILVTLIIIAFLLILFMPGVRAANLGDNSGICISRNIGHSSNSFSYVALDYDPETSRLFCLLNDQDKNISCAHSCSFNSTSCAISSNFSMKGTSNNLQGLVMDFNRTQGAANTFKAYVADGGSGPTNGSIHQIEWVSSPGGNATVNSTRNYTGPENGWTGMTSNYNRSRSESPRHLYLINATNGRPSLFHFDLNTTTWTGNCTLGAHVMQVENLMAQPGTEDIWVVNRRNWTQLFRYNDSGTCLYLTNITHEVNSNPNSVTGMVRIPGVGPVMSVNERVNLTDVFYASTLFGGSTFLYVNSSIPPMVVSYSSNDSAERFNGSVGLRAQINESVCVNVTMQLLTNITGAMMLNDTVSAAVSASIRATGNGNETNVTRIFALSDPRACVAQIGFAVQACSAAGACVNSSTVSVLSGPNFTFSNDTLPRAPSYSCLGPENFSITFRDSGVFNLTAALRPTYNATSTECNYRVSCALMSRNNLTGQDCIINATGVTALAGESCFIYRDDSISHTGIGANGAVAVGAGVIIVGSAAALLYYSRRKVQRR